MSLTGQIRTYELGSLRLKIDDVTNSEEEATAFWEWLTTKDHIDITKNVPQELVSFYSKQYYDQIYSHVGYTASGIPANELGKLLEKFRNPPETPTATEPFLTWGQIQSYFRTKNIGPVLFTKFEQASGLSLNATPSNRISEFTQTELEVLLSQLNQ